MGWQFPDTSKDKLIELAQKEGKSIEAYASDLVQRAVDNSRNFSEILAPFRREVAESGMDERELDELFEAARNAVPVKKP